MCSTNFFQHLEHYVGIDVSKAPLDCWLRPAGQWMQCSNDGSGFAKLGEWLRSFEAVPSDSVICLENTGIYDDRLLAVQRRKNHRPG